MAAPRTMNGSGASAGSRNAAMITPVQSTRLSSTVFQAPMRLASAPRLNAPPKARNCTSRIVMIRVLCSRRSSSVPYWLARVMTVWMPSL